MSTPPKKRILVIDDNLEHLLLDKTILEMQGLEVFTAQSGKDGLAILSEIDRPNLILLDVHMGDMSGPEFLQALEEQKPEIIECVPVVFLTASDTVPPSRAVGFIRKPMELDQFLLDVQHFMEMGTCRS